MRKIFIIILASVIFSFGVLVGYTIKPTTPEYFRYSGGIKKDVTLTWYNEKGWQYKQFWGDLKSGNRYRFFWHGWGPVE